MVGCIAVEQTDRQTDGHPTVLIRACDVRCTSSGRGAALEQTDGQTDRHPIVTVRQCDVGRTSSGRLHNSGTDRRTD